MPSGSPSSSLLPSIALTLSALSRSSAASATKAQASKSLWLPTQTFRGSQRRFRGGTDISESGGGSEWSEPGPEQRRIRPRVGS